MSAESDFSRAIYEFFQDDPATGYYIREVGEGTYDPNTSLYTADLEEIPVRVILQDLTYTANGVSTKYGTLIQMGDKDCYILPPNKECCLNDPINLDPTKDRLRVGNITYKIAVVKSADPTGSNALVYNILLKR